MKKDIICVCAPYDRATIIIPDSEIKECHACGNSVCVSPSTKKRFAEDLDSVRFLCMECAADQLKKDQLVGMSIDCEDLTKEQMAELQQHMKNHINVMDLTAGQCMEFLLRRADDYGKAVSWVLTLLRENGPGMNVLMVLLACLRISSEVMKGYEAELEEKSLSAFMLPSGTAAAILEEVGIDLNKAIREGITKEQREALIERTRKFKVNPTDPKKEG